MRRATLHYRRGCRFPPRQLRPRLSANALPDAQLFSGPGLTESVNLATE